MNEELLRAAERRYHGLVNARAEWEARWKEMALQFLEKAEAADSPADKLIRQSLSHDFNSLQIIYDLFSDSLKFLYGILILYRQRLAACYMLRQKQKLSGRFY